MFGHARALTLLSLFFSVQSSVTKRLRLHVQPARGRRKNDNVATEGRADGWKLECTADLASYSSLGCEIHVAYGSKVSRRPRFASSNYGQTAVEFPTRCGFKKDREEKVERKTRPVESEFRSRTLPRELAVSIDCVI